VQQLVAGGWLWWSVFDPNARLWRASLGARADGTVVVVPDEAFAGELAARIDGPRLPPPTRFADVRIWAAPSTEVVLPRALRRQPPSTTLEPTPA
jgi:hypothetical protein